MILPVDEARLLKCKYFTHYKNPTEIVELKKFTFFLKRRVAVVTNENTDFEYKVGILKFSKCYLPATEATRLLYVE